MFHMSAKHVLGGQLKMNVLDVRETPFGRTSTNQRQKKKRTCNLKMKVLDVRKTPLGRTSTNQRQ